MNPKRSTYTVEEAKRKMEGYCAYQERSHKEVEDKLKELGLITQAREMILLHLLEQDYLNEERFSRSFARGKFRMKKWGRKRIEIELKYRGVSSYNIRQGLSEIEEKDYEEALREVARKRYESTLEPHPMKKRKKVADFLLRKGFESNRVYAVLMDLENEDQS